MDKQRTTTNCRLFVSRASTRFASTDRRLLFCLLSALFFLLTHSSYVYAADAESALSGMQRRYASVQTISGFFQISYISPEIEQVESGEFWLKKPALMRWEYRYPEEKLFVADGKETYFYEPLDRQVTVQPFTAEDLRNTPLKFLLGAEDIGNDFSIEPVHEFGKESGGTQTVRLNPKSRTEYAFLILEIDEATFDLRRLTIHEQGGNTLEYVFIDLKMNVKINNREFRFKIPKDVEVHRMENDE